MINNLLNRYKQQNIDIRLATPSDAEGMAEVHMRSWESAYKDIIPVDFIREKNATRPEQFRNMITAENNSHYVITVNDRIIGILTVDFSRDDDADDSFYEVHGIYLHPDYYRKGIGTQAMEFAFDKACRLGKSIITLWVLADNTNSIRFYEKCGFFADGKTQTLNYGKDLVCIRMRKDLAI